MHTSGVISLYKTQKVLTDVPNTSQYSSTKGCDKHYFNKLFWLDNKETTQELFADLKKGFKIFLLTYKSKITWNESSALIKLNFLVYGAMTDLCHITALLCRHL